MPVFAAPTPMSRRDRLDLLGHRVRRHLVEPGHAERVLHGDGGDRRHAVHPAGQERLQVGLRPGAAAGVRAGDRQRRRRSRCRITASVSRRRAARGAMAGARPRDDHGRRLRRAASAFYDAALGALGLRPGRRARATRRRTTPPVEARRVGQRRRRSGRVAGGRTAADAGPASAPAADSRGEVEAFHRARRPGRRAEHARRAAGCLPAPASSTRSCGPGRQPDRGRRAGGLAFTPAVNLDLGRAGAHRLSSAGAVRRSAGVVAGGAVWSAG